MPEMEASHPDTAVIMATATTDTKIAIQCMKQGAYDYITKPFGASELIARVRAVMRRTEAAAAVPTQPSFASGDLQFSFAQRRVTIAGKEVKLTPTECSLLQEFVLNAGRVLTNTHLLNKVWGPEYLGETHLLQVTMARLRQKLSDDARYPRYIVTRPSIGYTMKQRRRDQIVTPL